MRVLIDTNVLIRLFQSSNPSAPVAASAIHELRRHNFEVVMVPQNLYELWVVSTRPVALNGFGMTASDASVFQDKCIERFGCFVTSEGFSTNGRRLFHQARLLGKVRTMRG